MWFNALYKCSTKGKSMITPSSAFNSLKKSNNIVTQSTKVSASANADVNSDVQNKSKEGLYAGVGLSLVTLGTLGGIYYFAKHGNAKIKTFSNGPSTQTMADIQQYAQNNATFIYMSDGFKSQTMQSKPRWNALVSGFTQSVEEESGNVKKQKNKSPKDWRQARKDEVIPGIIRQISVGIKDYIKRCGIDKNNNKVNPKELDDILTKAVGTDKVKERPYLENGIKGRGRVKEYLSPNGRVYVLESHDSPKGVVTRLYMHDKDKNLRAYLHADGTFRLNSYTSDEAHFSTTAKGKRWMDESKFYDPQKQD